MSSEQVGGFVMGAIFLTLVLLIPFSYRQGRINALRPLAEVLEPSSAETNRFFESQLDGRYGGRSVILLLHNPLTRDDRNRFCVLLGLRSSISYRARRERFVDRIDRKLFFSPDIETGVAELDSRFAFSSLDPERFRQWVVGSNAVQDAFKVLLEDRGVDVLSQEDGWLNATMYCDSLDDRTSPEYVRGILDSMSVLAQSAESI